MKNLVTSIGSKKEENQQPSLTFYSVYQQKFESNLCIHLIVVVYLKNDLLLSKTSIYCCSCFQQKKAQRLKQLILRDCSVPNLFQICTLMQVPYMLIGPGILIFFSICGWNVCHLLALWSLQVLHSVTVLPPMPMALFFRGSDQPSMA